MTAAWGSSRARGRSPTRSATSSRSWPGQLDEIVGIGGDPVVGSSFIDILERFEADAETETVVLVGEIGGDEEEKAARFIEESMTKPVFAYIAGFTAPPGKTMGHARRDHLRLGRDRRGEEGGAGGFRRPRRQDAD